MGMGYIGNGRLGPPGIVGTKMQSSKPEIPWSMQYNGTGFIMQWKETHC